jgi:glycosyltransferase involved in cell wall biosynthesis
MLSAVISSSDADGGAEAYMVRLYSLLQDRGINGHLVGRMSRWTRESLPASFVETGPKWNGRDLLKGIPRLPRERGATGLAVRSLRPDVIHMHFKREQIGMTRALSRDTPVIWTEHGKFPDAWDGRILAAGYRAAARHVAHIICVSESVADEVSHIVPARAPISVIPNAVDSDYFRPVDDETKMAARARLGLPESGPLVVYVGQLHEAKLPLLAASTSHHMAANVAMFGDGPALSQLRDLASTSPNLYVMGRTRDVRLAYEAADALIFTSSGIGEGMPFSVIEAAAVGLPIVSNVGHGMEKFIAALGGLLCDPTPPALAAGLTAAIGDRAAGIRAREWVESNDLHSWVEKHERILQSQSRSSRLPGRGWGHDG